MPGGVSRVLLRRPGGAEGMSTLYTSCGRSGPLYPDTLFKEQRGLGPSRSRTIAPGLWPLGIEPRTIQLGVFTTHPAPHINMVPYLCQHVTCRNTSQQANHSVHGQRWRGRSVLISRSRWLSQITQRAHCFDSIFNSSLVCVVHCSYSIVM